MKALTKGGVNIDCSNMASICDCIMGCISRIACVVWWCNDDVEIYTDDDWYGCRISLGKSK